MTRWFPHTTVAAIVEKDGRFLMVEEKSDDGTTVINQPAGHLEHGEPILQALVRETLEETRFEVEPAKLLGIYRWIHPDGHTYIRFTLSATVIAEHTERKLDPAILRPLWLTAEEIRNQYIARSPLVISSIDDYMSGRHFPLELFVDIAGH